MGPTGWYTDTTLQINSLHVRTRSSRGLSASTHGYGAALSVESGYPFYLSPRLTVEPQAQLTWQKLALKNLRDGMANVSFPDRDQFQARAGVRMQSKHQPDKILWMPYLRADLLQDFGAEEKTSFSGKTTFKGINNSTAAQTGVGVTGMLSQYSSVYVSLNYTTNIGGQSRDSVGGNMGVRFSW
ncbi:MAG: autotransporter domain-containing protein [Enterobacteriaceae bacterium]